VTGWWLPAVAFAAMYVQDIVAVVMVQAEGDERAKLAGMGDVLQDACGLASLAAIGDGVVGGHLWLTVATVAARLAADFCGTWTGVRVGARIRKGRT
jgi:hypothetical protein